MKKIAIVTWTRGCNYGTILQAYSLSDFLNKNGNDAVLLDDSKLNQQFEDNPNSKEKSVVLPQKQVSKITCFLRKIKKAIGVILSPKKRRQYRNERVFEEASQQKLLAFRTFKKEYLKQTNPMDENMLESVGKEYDVYICGSDQIWTYRSDRVTNYYYLGFTADEKQRVAYAPCIGEREFPAESIPLLRQLLARFSAISMRDEHGATLLKKLTEQEIAIVTDPVLLKTKEDWISDFSLSERGEKYLLCYLLGKHKWYEKKIKRISKRLKLPIRWIPVNPEQASFLKFGEEPCGPREFLELFRNASFVCTDSYHGTLFSLIFEKQFVNFERYTNEENSQNQRFYSIYRKLCLPNRLLTEADPVDELPAIPYDSVKEKIGQFRKDSQAFLFDELGVKQ